MNEEKKVTTLAVHDSVEHGYTMRYVTVRVMIEETLASRIDGCIDNKVGYREDEYAKRALDRYRALESMGATVVYDNTYSDSSMSFTLKYQLYAEEDGVKRWCDVTFEDMGRRLEAIEKAAKFVKRVARKIAKAGGREICGRSVEWAISDPEKFIEAAASMKGVVRVCHYNTHLGDLSNETVRLDEARGHEEAA